MNRRDILKAGMLTGAVGLFPFIANGCEATGRGDAPFDLRTKGKIRNIIFFVYDGFSWEDFAMAKFYSRTYLKQTLALEKLFTLGLCGTMEPSSLTSIVTDSAAATSAWATGRKIVNGSLSMFPDGTALVTIMDLAHSAGKARGIITTTRLTHATPAGWIAKIGWRRKEDEIALQYLQHAPEVMLGGGSRHFHGGRRADGRDLFFEFSRKGYTVITDRKHLHTANGSRLLGTFADSHIPFDIDRRFQSADAPTLKEMTQKGLEVLRGYENGFILQIEAGRIDHANHRNDAGAALWEILAADDALSHVMNFADEEGATLLIVASDHGTGGGVVFGVGERYRASTRALEYMRQRRASFEHIIDILGSDPSVHEIITRVQATTGAVLTRDQAYMVRRAIHGEFVMPSRETHDRQPYNTLAHVLTGNDYLRPERLNVHYATGQHTAGPVPVAVYGVGTSDARLGLVDNTTLFQWMSHALQIRYDNPLVTAEEALQILGNEAVENLILM